METIDVIITKDDFIEGADFENHLKCPFANAVNRIVPGAFVVAGVWSIRINDSKYTATPPFRRDAFERCRELIQKGKGCYFPIKLTKVVD